MIKLGDNLLYDKIGWRSPLTALLPGTRCHIIFRTKCPSWRKQKLSAVLTEMHVQRFINIYKTFCYIQILSNIFFPFALFIFHVPVLDFMTVFTWGVPKGYCRRLKNLSEGSRERTLRRQSEVSSCSSSSWRVTSVWLSVGATLKIK